MANRGFDSSLRTILFADALACVACGALMSLAAGPLSALTLLPPSLLLYAGLSLFPVAAYIAVVAAKASDHPAAVWLVIAGNALWVAASLWLMLGGAVQPNLLGRLFLGAQAAVVAVLTTLEARGAKIDFGGAAQA